MAAKRKPVTSRSITAKQVATFLSVLSETANVSEACRQAKIYRQWAYEQREKDAEFSRLWDEAVEISTDALEAEARRRALEGVEKPVFYQGQECGRIREFSDTLMVVLLKAHRPEKYKDRQDVNHSGGVVVEIVC